MKKHFCHTLLSYQSSEIRGFVSLCSVSYCIIVRLGWTNIKTNKDELLRMKLTVFSAVKLNWITLTVSVSYRSDDLVLSSRAVYVSLLTSSFYKETFENTKQVTDTSMFLKHWYEKSYLCYHLTSGLCLEAFLLKLFLLLSREKRDMNELYVICHFMVQHWNQQLKWNDSSDVKYALKDLILEFRFNDVI